MKAAKDERPVVVTTEFKGVFFGYTKDSSESDPIKLRAARMCLYWSPDVKGVLGLAANGPTKGCRVSPACDMTLPKITSVMEVTKEAEKAWLREPWG